MFLNKNISTEAQEIHQIFNQNFSTAKKITTAALLAGLAALFQSFGDLLPGIGYIITPFSTFPILIISLYSMLYGSAGYCAVMLLLLFIMPGELVVFPFTTGLLGLGLAAGILKIKKRGLVILLNSILLLSGISLLLYVFNFPVLGPAANSQFNIRTFAFIYIFALVYSSLCTEVGLWLIKRLRRIPRQT